MWVARCGTRSAGRAAEASSAMWVARAGHLRAWAAFACCHGLRHSDVASCRVGERRLSERRA